MRYGFIIEEAGETYSAYVPDLPGCVATGATTVEAKTEITAAIRLQLDGLKEDGLPIPPPHARVAIVEA